MVELPNAQIKHMAERFLNWKLPADFNPDGGISATRPNYAPNVPWVLTGTNLFDYSQAVEMVRHMVEGLPGEARTEAIVAIEALQGEMREALEEARSWLAAISSEEMLPSRTAEENLRKLLAKIDAALSEKVGE